MDYYKKLKNLEKQGEVLLFISISLLTFYFGAIFISILFNINNGFLFYSMFFTIIPCFLCVSRGETVETKINNLKNQFIQEEQTEKENSIEQYYRDFKNSL